MLEVSTLQEEREKKETTEFIEALKSMSESEKQQVKGIMLGIKLAKDSFTHKAQ